MADRPGGVARAKIVSRWPVIRLPFLFSSPALWVSVSGIAFFSPPVCRKISCHLIAGASPQDKTAMGHTFHITLETPFGYMRPVSDGNFLIRLDWDQSPFSAADNPDDVSRETMMQLSAYLEGDRQSFDLPIRAEGKSTTGRHWLEVMARIPYGEVITYSDFAMAAGKPKAPRAAGTACASNPIPIIYPCHRVVRADGTLGNYGGGSALDPKHPENLGRKRALIDLERRFA